MTKDLLAFPLPEKSETLLSLLETRRSNLAKQMSEPGPTPEELERIMTIAVRVPDHRKLTPWRFLKFSGEARSAIGKHIAAAFKKDNPDLPIDRVLFESGRFLRAPLIIGVVSSPKDCPRGTPKWEQELSSAIVCYNMCLAAQASGYGAQWLTEWYAYDAHIMNIMGLKAGEKIAGLIYIGTATEAPVERTRPDIDPLIEDWTGKSADA